MILKSTLPALFSRRERTFRVSPEAISSMHLFSNIQRTNVEPLQSLETSFDFMNRVSGNYWDAMRSTLENWFATIPSDSQPDLRARPMAKSRKQFEGAF